MVDKSYVGPKPELVTPIKFDTVPDVEVSWLWEPFIPLGDVTIVEGDGMAGKTTAMIRLASMVSKGEIPPAMRHGELLEEQTTEPANVLYIGIEANNETEIKPAIRYGKGDPSRMFFLDQSERPFLLTEEYVREAIEKTKCKLLIMDPYTSFLPSGISLGNAVSMRRLLSRLMQIARETKTAIVLVGHLSKNPYGKQIYSGYGSADIINTVRSVLLISRDDDDNRFLRILKSNYFGVDAFFKVGLSMDDDNCVQFEDFSRMMDMLRQEEKELMTTEEYEEAEPVTRTGQCKMEIINSLSDGAKTKSEVLAELMPMGYSERTISRAFKGMGGISYFEGRTGYWKLPDEEEE